MKQHTSFVLVALSIVIGGCGSSGITNLDSTPSPTTPPSPSAASASPLAGTPKPTPAPTLASTTEEASQAPPGAISIELGGFRPPRFDPDQVTTKAGKVVLFLKNVGDQYEGYHDFVMGPALYQVLARSTAIDRGDSAIFTVKNLPAGTYTFWCEVGGHASLGMVGTLTVTP